MTMKRYRIFLATLVAIMSTAFSNAQDIEQLWATGSAVLDGTCQLTKRPDGQFRFAGALNPGDLKIMTTEHYTISQTTVSGFLSYQ